MDTQRVLTIRLGERMSPMWRTACVFPALLLWVMVIGCGSVAKKSVSANDILKASPAQDVSYRIAPGDELEIAFFHTPELNLTIPVRPDGRIAVPLAQGIVASGKTPEELATELRRLYRGELKDPEIAVIVRTFTDYQIHIGGEVDEAGVQPLVGRVTVLQAIFAAGGFLPRARLDEVLVIRPNSEQGHSVITLNLERAIDGRDPTQNLVLRPYDAVFVPPSRIANVNTWVDLYIRQNIPINFGIRPDVP